MNQGISSRDFEILSAYLDGELSVREATLLQKRLQNEPQLAIELNAIQQTRTMLRSLPRLRAPRRFTLHPEQVTRRPSYSRLVPVFGASSAIAALLLIFVIIGDLLTSQPAVSPLAAEAEPAQESFAMAQSVEETATATLEATPETAAEQERIMAAPPGFEQPKTSATPAIPYTAPEARLPSENYSAKQSEEVVRDIAVPGFATQTPMTPITVAVEINSTLITATNTQETPGVVFTASVITDSGDANGITITGSIENPTPTIAVSHAATPVPLENPTPQITPTPSPLPTAIAFLPSTPTPSPIRSDPTIIESQAPDSQKRLLLWAKIILALIAFSAGLTAWHLYRRQYS